MVIVWIIIAVVIVALLIAAAIWSKGRWVLIVAESGARADWVDRFQAYLKSVGIKSRIQHETGGVVRLQVLRSETDRTRNLLEQFKKDT